MGIEIVLQCGKDGKVNIPTKYRKLLDMEKDNYIILEIKKVVKDPTDFISMMA